MKGYIYIASYFETVNRSACGQNGSVIDNDPHFWTDPPTWGICRNDLRAAVRENDVVFFVLPRHGRHPQTVFGYLTVERVITHLEAFHDTTLSSKRMTAHANPNGNIIVTASGAYNPHDGGAHFHKWERIAKHYAVGRPESSKILTARQLSAKAPTFLAALSKILNKPGSRAIDLISRKGTRLTQQQVRQLIDWIDHA